MLCLVREEPTYGLVLVGLLARDGSLGQVWSVPRAVVYRALQRLELLGLIRTIGVDSRDLLQAQLTQLLPVAAALDDRLRATTGFEHTLVLWRHEAMTATMRFLAALTASDKVG